MYASNVLFLSEAWKAGLTGSPWDPYEITLLRSDEYGRSMGVLVYFGHMDARTRKFILRVPQGPYGFVRTYRL